MKNMNKKTRSSFINYGIIVLFYLLIQILGAMGLMTRSLSGQLVPICAYIIMAVSLNLVVGVSGELSLGHAGFMSIGAFTGVIFAGAMKESVTFGPARLLIAIVIGAIVAGIVGVLVGIPVLRLHGDYLAIVTLAFGEIIKNVVNCLYVGLDETGLHFSMSGVKHLNMDPAGTLLINGPMGGLGISKLSTFLSGIVLVLVTLFIIQNLINSRSGRAIMAIRDNRIAAEASGLNITKYKLMAFVTSAALAGAAGVLYAMNFSTIAAKKFDFNTSILILVFVVLGGMGNIRGSIIAAGLLTVLPEILRAVNDYRMLVYAIVLVLVMIATNNDQARDGLKRFIAKITGRRTMARKKGGAGNE